jgi:FAD/FMN-containing dehydrogenase
MIREVVTTRRRLMEAMGVSLLALAEPRLFGVAALATRPAIDPEALRKLSFKLRGRLVAPGDRDYDALRRVWNARFDRHPGAIVRCASTDDVARTVDFARTHGLPVAVRSGGHSQAGLSVCDDGVVIDLSRMKAIQVDRTRRIARAQPGLTRLEFERATQAHGLVTSMGQCQDVGIGGLTLGGGEGALAGRFGASCDNVVGSTVVLADGRVLRANEQENPDLLWGVCGGGGNLGVVTELTYRLYPLREAVAGWYFYPFEQTRTVLRAWREFTRTLPDALFTELAVQRPDEKTLLATIYVFHSEPERAETDLAPLRKCGRVLRESVRRQPYLEAQAAAGFPVVTGLSSMQRSGFVTEIGDGLIEAIAATPPPRAADCWFAHLHGEIARLPQDRNAYHQRRPGYTFWAEADWKGSEPRPAIEWVEEVWKVARPLCDGVYVNMVDTEPGREREAYGANYERLAQLKRKYDPENFFRANVNVTPA